MKNLAVTQTRSVVGLAAAPVCVEVHLAPGLPHFGIVGLPEAAVKESKDRVRSAISNSHFEFPMRRITVNLAPATLPKSGSGFDLPIALGILAASGQIPTDNLSEYVFIGELALGGDLRGVTGIIPVVLSVYQDKQTLILPTMNADEAALAQCDNIYSASSLRDVCHRLKTHTPFESLPPYVAPSTSEYDIDWSDVKGQAHAKQALIIAAAGGHSALLYGPPGSGKTMLAKRFMTLLPELNETQALECAAVHSIRGHLPKNHAWRQPPFRSPHHTASAVALVGGGNPPKPGEISLAHHGVLFLDELPEFNRHTLETLREPIESGHICISRAAIQVEYPAKFQLIGAMNPCPCGHFGNPYVACICSPDRVNRYLGKLSGPFLDRLDMHIPVHALPAHELITSPTNVQPESPQLKAHITHLRTLQLARQGMTNATLSVKACEQIAALGSAEKTFLATAMSKLNLSARAYHRLLKVARTIADLNASDTVTLDALQQALSFRQMVNAGVC